MNPYEKRFKEVLQSNRDKQESYIEQSSVHKVSLQRAKDGIKALENSLTLLTDPIAIKALQDAQVQLSKDVDRITRNISAAEESLASVKTDFYLLQSLCPHVDKVYDHTDYHKNEEFHKCTLCGDIR